MKKFFIALALVLGSLSVSSCIYEENSDYMFDVQIEPSSLDLTWKYDAFGYIRDAAENSGFEYMPSDGSFILYGTNKKEAYKMVKNAVNTGMDQYDSKPAGIEDLSDGTVVVTDFLNGRKEVMRRTYKNKFNK